MQANKEQKFLQEFEPQQDIYSYVQYQQPANNFVRYYTQEELYDSQSLQSNSNPYPTFKLPFNKIIGDVITDVLNMNIVIAMNTRTSISFLQNGKEIAIGKDLASGKNKFWQEMLKDVNFTKIKKAYQLIPVPTQQIIKYTIFALSNLLLKLGINMSKICMLFFQKILTFKCLSIMPLSITFLMYLEYQLYVDKKKNIKDNQSMDSTFLRQLPKISIIKLSYRRNTQQIQILQKVQNYFFTKCSPSIKNLQFIQLYQNQGEKYKRQFNYEHIISINIKQTLGISAPFSFQIMYFMKHYIFHLVRDFKPDLLLFVEQYPQNKIVIDAQIRGLLLSQIIEHLTPKIYFMRQYGCQQYIFGNNPLNQFNQNLQNQQQKKLIAHFEKQQKKFYQSYEKRVQDPYNFIKTTKKIMLDDIAFISLSLLQKGNFNMIRQASHKHQYKQHFVENVLNVIQIYKGSFKDEKDFKNKQNLLNSLKISQKVVGNLKDFLNYKILQNNIIFQLNNKKYNQVYNLKYNRVESLKINKQYQMVEDDTIYYQDNDHVLVQYKNDLMFVFILKEKSYIFLSKLYKDQYFKIIKRQTQWQEGYQFNKSCALVCSNYYLYRAFGIPINQQNTYSNQIYRHSIVLNQSGNLQNMKWEQLRSECIHRQTPPSNKGNSDQNNKIPIQKKHSAYGVFDSNNNKIIFMGGYLDSVNEQKIGKKLYIIKQTDNKQSQQKMKEYQIYSTPKTNTLIFTNTNNRGLLLPTIFGMPFEITKSNSTNIMILNTNGDYTHLNNAGKLFLTQYSSGDNINKSGIKLQSKILATQQNKIQMMTFQSIMIDYVVLGSIKINRYQNRVSMIVPQQGHMIFEIIQKDKTLKAIAINQQKQRFLIKFGQKKQK